MRNLIFATIIVSALQQLIGCAGSEDDTPDEALATQASAGASAQPSSPSEFSGQLDNIEKGRCGDTFNPVTSGGKAHWTLTCSGGTITVSGWVEDTDADGQCAAVKANFADGSSAVSERACPKGTRKNFSWTMPGSLADVYLFES